MITIRGRRYSVRDLAEYYGDSSCLSGFRRYELREGRAEGCRITQIKTGSGLALEINESRGMDLGQVVFDGIPISYASYNREVNPCYYETFGDGWLRSYAGGMLVTGGLASMGSPELDGSEVLPLHGRISNIPAERVNVIEGVDSEGRPTYEVSGLVRESKALNYNLVLKRAVRATQGENRFFIEDEIENQGFDEQELMLLYHFNVGHPVVSEDSRLLTHSLSVTSRDEDAKNQAEPYDRYVAPTPHYKDIVYYHELAESNGVCAAAIVNEPMGVGVYLKFDKTQLDCFTQWKFLGQGNYVAGIEPGNAFVSGRSVERKEGRIKTIGPRESKKISIEVGVLTSGVEIENFKRENGFEEE